MRRGLLRVVLMIISLASLLLVAPPVYAQTTTATFTLTPASASYKPNQTFIVEVRLKASANKKISSARALITFDPTKLEITDAVQSGTDFCSYPSDTSNYVADNTQGLVMITAIASGTSECPYPEVGKNGILFARIPFKAKEVGTTEVSFIFNGQQTTGNNSSIVDTNSPPQSIITQPAGARYTIQTNATPTPTPSRTSAPKAPDDLGADPRFLIVLGVGIVGIGYLLVKTQVRPRVVTITESSEG